QHAQQNDENDYKDQDGHNSSCGCSVRRFSQSARGCNLSRAAQGSTATGVRQIMGLQCLCCFFAMCSCTNANWILRCMRSIRSTSTCTGPPSEYVLRLRSPMM